MMSHPEPFAAEPEGIKICSSIKSYIQEVFHVYLNKFENAVAHFFLVILGNN